MNAGQMQSLKELIEFLKQQEVGEFDLEQGDLKVHLSFMGHGASATLADLDQVRHTGHSISKAAHPPATTASPSAESHPSSTITPPPAAGSTSEEAGLHIVKSPIVGTFYESSAPGADPFVKVGDQVESGQVICIVEAMKLMNEIECDGSGEIVKRMVTNGQPVEYGQALFAIRPR
ncbi:MAG: acetyl-CoA carboxylase biotin carboxyl carrier protein [Acidobacteriaceae bacterium]